jgi:hypothetical protein
MPAKQAGYVAPEDATTLKGEFMRNFTVYALLTEVLQS